MPLYRKFLEFAGIEPERFHVQWVSASEGGLFTEVVTEFTEKLRALPPIKRRTAIESFKNPDTSVGDS